MTTRPHHTVLRVPPANCFSLLIVDDTAHLRLLLSKFLAGCGYEVADAPGGAEALDLVRESNPGPDLVLTDVEMPGMDGLELLHRIRSLDGPVAEVPIVATSGNPEEVLHRRALRAGADQFLAKPFELREVRQIVAALLEKRRLGVDRSAETGVLEVAHRHDTSFDAINRE